MILPTAYALAAKKRLIHGGWDMATADAPKFEGNTHATVATPEELSSAQAAAAARSGTYAKFKKRRTTTPQSEQKACLILTQCGATISDLGKRYYDRSWPNNCFRGIAGPTRGTIRTSRKMLR